MCTRRVTKITKVINWFGKSEPDGQLITGRHVLLIDDIFDEGVSLATIVAKIQTYQPLSVKSCVLPDKVHDRKVPDFTLILSAPLSKTAIFTAAAWITTVICATRLGFTRLNKMLTKTRCKANAADLSALVALPTSRLPCAHVALV